jgi:enamine deaminase RidA (YjgF/YER057c/UK114 family)
VDRRVTTPHEILNPPTLAEPVGFAHAVVAASGRTVYLGGQAAIDAEGRVVGTTMAEQFEMAAANVVVALRAAGAEPEDLVSMQIFVTNVEAYRSELSHLATAYGVHFGHHYPAISLFEVKGLFDPAALVELVCVAVVPDQR